MDNSVVLAGLTSITSVIGLAVAQIPLVQEALEISGSTERLGLIGVLSLVAILSTSGLIWLVRLGVRELIALIRQASTAISHATDVMESTKETNERVAKILDRMDERGK